MFEDPAEAIETTKGVDLVASFEEFAEYVKGFQEEDAWSYVQSALSNDANDVGRLRKIAKLLEEGQQRIGKKLSKDEVKAGLDALCEDGGVEGALAAIETRFNGKLSSERIEYYLSKSRNNIDSDTVILGSTGKYDVIAQNEGYTYFKMNDNIWDQLVNESGSNYDIIWEVNKKFINEQFILGKKILLSNNPNKGYYFNDGTKRFFQRELDYIIEQGYEFEKISNNLWQAVRK